MDERFDVIVLGRQIGTATGWDVLGSNSSLFWGFEPTEGVNLPAGDLGILYETGKFEQYNNNGEVSFSADIIETTRDVERTN